MSQLALPAPRLLCSLVHKFGLDARGKADRDFDEFIRELQAEPKPDGG